MKSTLRNACQTLLRPIASVLMKAGMTWKEFSDLSKAVFVSVAGEEFGIRGRPTNVSRTSILTGISRKEVKRQRELMQAAQPTESSKTTDATRLLSGWHQDPHYLDASGEPKPLPETGSAPSFESLFATYGGDTPEQTLVKELHNSKSIVRNDEGELVANSRYYMPVDVSTEWIEMAGQLLHDLGANIDYNIAADEAQKSRFLGFAIDDEIPADSADEFRDFMEEQGQQFLQLVDDWLAERRSVSKNIARGTPLRLGVGLFTIQNDKD